MSDSPAKPADLSAAVEIYIRALFEGCKAAASTLLGRSVSVDLRLPLLEPKAFNREDLTPPWMVADLRYGRGVAGGHELLIASDDTVALARLVLGEDASEVGPATPDHQDAFKELLNQMLSSASSALKLVLDKPVVLTLGEMREVEDTSTWTPHAALMAVGHVHVDGVQKATLALTVPQSVCEEAAAAQEITRAKERPAGARGADTAGLDMILDITMPITVELGRTRMLIRDILALAPGSVVELEKLAGEPVDLLVNDKPIARGEVVVIDENFGVRLTQITQAGDRIRSLR